MKKKKKKESETDKLIVEQDIIVSSLQDKYGERDYKRLLRALEIENELAKLENQ